jgi:hypothetical protein
MTNHNTKWFIVKVRYTKQLENGSFKRVTEPYLLPAYTFTDGEARIYDELGSIIKGEFDVTSMATTDAHEIFQYEDSEVWYKVVIKFESVNDETEKTKVVKNTMYITASSVEQAADRIKESLATSMRDFKIDSVSETPIVEVFAPVTLTPLTDEEMALLEEEGHF